MKKKFYLLLIVLFLFPLQVNAKDGTKRMYINMDIQKDGSVQVTEVAELSGKYNGRLRDINYANPGARIFSGSYEDFKGSSIYNGSTITDLKVCETAPNISKESFGKCEKEYELVSSAYNGGYGVYEKSESLNGVSLKIYNPSVRKKAFYLSYTIQDVVVVHNDVAEIAWNILGDSYEEDISDLKVWVNLPEKDSDLRVFLKGSEKTLNGEIKKINDQTAYIYYNFLGAYNPITVRMIFDKREVPFATKLSGIAGKDNILKVEKEAAEEANRIRERIQRQNNIIIAITVFWYIIAVISLLCFVRAKKKNKQVDFFQDYYRDFPGEYGPEVLEYLWKKNVTDLGMSASILNIIEKGTLKVEENPEKEKDYFLILEDKELTNLTENEKRLCKLFIENIGNGEKVSMNEVRQYGKSTTKARKMVNTYNTWKNQAMLEGKKQEFFVNTHITQVICLVVGFLSFAVMYFNISFDTAFIPGYFTVILGMIIAFCSLSYSFKTPKGALEYAKWQAFKRFIEDFGMLQEKELPEIKLWGKYLVYATVLGCADNLEKAMRVHLEAMQEITEGAPTYLDYYYTRRMMQVGIYHSIHSSVHTAVSSSRSSIAASSSSSSSGFGGGSSFGGGSFGGGGGGGRF